MAEGEVQFRRAEPADIDALLRLQAGYYQEDGYPHDKGKARRAWEIFLSDTSLGSAWAVDSAPGLVGYVVVTLGYSLEYLGIDAFIDELYLVPAVRGQGLGRKALSVAEAACVELGAKALHLRGRAGQDWRPRTLSPSGLRRQSARVDDETTEAACGVTAYGN